MIRGYDIDGVITKGIRPEHRDDYIITGRSHQNSLKTLEMLRNKGIFNAVYFNPVPSGQVTPLNSADWKIVMINILGVELYVEDDPFQIQYIRQYCENVEIREIPAASGYPQKSPESF